MLTLTTVIFGILFGIAAHIVTGAGSKPVDWVVAIVAGLVGSLLGALVVNLIKGWGWDYHTWSFVGAIVGAFILLAIVIAARGRRVVVS